MISARLQTIIPTWVRIRGIVYPGLEKGPFIKSGHGPRGAVALNIETGLAQCHECGRWFASIGSHVKAHGMTSRVYKLKHGIRLGSSLDGDNGARSRNRNHHNLTKEAKEKASQSRARRREEYKVLGINAPHVNITTPDEERAVSRAAKYSVNSRSGIDKAESRNERSSCHAQVLNTLRKLYEKLGRLPNTVELNEAGIHATSACDMFSVKTIADIWEHVNIITPTGSSTGMSAGDYSRAAIIDLLRSFYVIKKRLPFNRELKAGGRAPSFKAIKLWFGDLATAYEAAGLGLVFRNKLPYNPQNLQHSDSSLTHRDDPTSITAEA